MPQPEGSLTPTQFEILQVVWDSGAEGATVSEIWQALAANRRVGRTSILNQVDRLETRRWLKRHDEASPIRYVAVQGRDSTVAELTNRFVGNFYDNSPKDLLVSLLGTTRLKPSDIEQLREMLESATKSRKKGK